MPFRHDDDAANVGADLVAADLILLRRESDVSQRPCYQHIVCGYTFIADYLVPSLFKCPQCAAKKVYLQ